MELHEKRRAIYWATAIALIGGGLLVRHFAWEGSTELHTLMELAATLLAAFVGIMALVRFFSRRDTQFLYIGTGFLGTALLDGFHAVVTSVYFQPYMPSDNPHLVPWSWMASRLFLSAWMFMSWVWCFRHRNDAHFRPNTTAVMLVATLATAVLFFFFATVPLPSITVEGWLVHRPAELLPALFFLLALAGYLYKGAWRNDQFEHWLVLSLMVGLGTQAIFMPYSEYLYDAEFNLAHLLKKLSYILVLVGLLNSLYQAYRELLREEEELLKASAYARSLIEASQDPLVMISDEGKITDVNLATEKATGMNRTELIGTDFSDYFTEPDKARAGYRQVFAQGSVTDYPLVLRHHDGSSTDVLYNASLYRNEAGKVLGVFAAARDVTERKSAEIALRESEKALKEAQRIANVGSWHMDLATNQISWSEELYKMYGFDPALPPPLYTESMKLFTPDSWERLSSAITRAAEAGIPYELELEMVTRDGSRKWMLARGELMRDESGAPAQVRGVVMDITERKQAEEQLRRSEHGLAEAQRIAHLGSWELDLTSGALVWSDEIYRIFEIDKDKFGASYEAFLNAIHPEDRDMVNKAYTESVANKMPYDIVHRLRMQDGRIKHVNEKCETYYDGDGKPIRSVGTVHDITERIQDEETLRRLNRELRAISNCNEILMRAESEQVLLDDICRIVCDDAGYLMAWVGYPENDEARSIRLIARAGAESGYLEQAQLTWADTERGRGPSGTAIRTGKSVSIQDFDTEPQAAPWREAAVQRGYRSSISLPLKDESAKVFGILNIYAARPDAFTPAEIRLLEELAGDMAFGIMVLRTRIERRQAEEELLERERHSQSLLRLSRNMERAQTYAEVLNAAREEVSGIVGYQSLWVYLLSDDRQYFKAFVAGGAVTDTVMSEAGTATLPIKGDRMLEEIAESKEIVLVEDARADERVNKEIVAQLGNRTIVNIPIMMFDRHLGCVGTGSFGDEGVRVPSSSEQQYLVAMASHMAVALDRIHLLEERRKAEMELRELNNDFVTLLENSGDFIYFKDKDSRIRFCSQTMANITGHRSWRDMIGKHDLEIFPAETARIYHEEEQPIFNEGKALLNKTDPYYDEQGKQGWVNTNKWPVFADDKKTVVGIFGISRDITELKLAENKITELNRDLEQRVIERTAQLDAANKELEAFSYSVSHDLRTPLRAIDGFSKILLEDYQDKLDDEGRRLLDVVRDNASKMGQLIDDILKFSRAGRLELSLSEINMEKMAHEVFAELQPFVAGGQLQLEIEPLPPAQGDRAMMHQVFVNLLSNALKFSRKRDPARIKVGCEIKGDEAVYYVKDNGAGFDMQYADKLFGVFQRLHGVTEFEGTGIGLAIVKRIVSRHGGRVWAEGKVGEGATMYFALPLKATGNQVLGAD